MRLPDPIANTTTEAYLAYKAGVLNIGDLKPSLYDPYLHFDAWLAYWAGLTSTYPVKGVGKNLAPITNGTTTFQQLTVSVDNDGVITINGPSTNSCYLKITNGVDSVQGTAIKSSWASESVVNDKSGKVLSIRYVSGSFSSEGIAWRLFNGGTRIAQYYPATSDIEAAYTASGGVSCIVLFVGANKTFDNYKVQIQLEEGSTATAFEPYTGTAECLTDEEALVAYLSGATNTYPEEYSDPIDARITGYLRYLVSARFGRPDYPVNNIEFYLSLMKPPIVTNETPSSNIELDNTCEAPFIDVKMFGDTSQQTYTGKNVIPNYMADTTQSNVTFKKNLDGSITITTSGTASARVEPYLWEKNHSAWPPTAIVLPEGTTYYNTTSRDLFWNSISASDGQSRYHRCPAGETYTTNSAETMNFIYIRVDSGESMNETIYPQMILDSVTDHSYEQYVGNIPAPSPDYPQAVQTVTGEQTVTVHGKNLFDKDDLEGHYFYNSYTYRPNAQNLDWDCSQIIPVESNTTYTISMSLKSGQAFSNAQIIFWDADKNGVGAVWGEIRGARTIGASVKFITIAYKNTTWENVQLEKNPAATTYEPYQEQSYEVNLGSIELCKIGNYQDKIYKDEQQWYLRKEIGKTNLKTDCTDWQVLNTNITAEKRYAVLVKQTDIPATDPATVTKPLFANTFGMVSRLDTYNRVQGIATCAANAQSEQNFIMYIKSISESSAATVDAIKNWLQNNETVVYYQSTTPTDTQITNPTLVAQLDALAAAKSYNDKTYITVEATDPNLPALLKVEAGEYR